MARKKQQAQPRAEASKSDQTEPMLEAIIGLLGRFIFPPDKLRDMVTKGKRKDPEQYVKAYNLLDGEHGVTEIAKEIGVAQPSLTSVLSSWKGLGIVYEIVKSGRPVYKGLYKLRSRREEASEEEDTEFVAEPVEVKEPTADIALPKEPEPSQA